MTAGLSWRPPLDYTPSFVPVDVTSHALDFVAWLLRGLLTRGGIEEGGQEKGGGVTQARRKRSFQNCESIEFLLVHAVNCDLVFQL